jgi:hypothetical protein
MNPPRNAQQTTFDACIFFALPEEAQAVIEIFESTCKVEFQSGRSFCDELFGFLFADY